MLGNLNKLLGEKLKLSQQQLRARDERILALETENAMLYLKLAEQRGLVRSNREKALLFQDMQRQEEKKQNKSKDKLLSTKQQIVSLRSDFEMLQKDIKQLPETFQSQLVDYNKGSVANILTAYSVKQNASTSDLNEKLRKAELALEEARRHVNVERTRRRTLHNTLVELRGNIRVHCRVRPLLAALDSHGDPDLLGLAGTQSEQVINAVDEENVLFSQLGNSNGSGTNKARSFEYERVYSQQDRQGDVFKDVSPLLTSLLDGYNVCIMAYGQTGSGKTHTMVGDHDLFDDVTNHNEESMEGVIPRSAKEIFRLIKERENATEKYNLEVSIFEVYNNEIVDLLAPAERRGVKHAVFSASDGSQEIPSLITKPITSAKEVMDYVTFGMLHRHEDRTKVHAHSSRSHLIVQLNIYQINASTNHSTTLQTNNSMLSPRNVMTPNSIRRASAIPTMKRSRSPAQKKVSRHPVSVSCASSRSPSPPPSSLSATTKIAVKTKLQLVDLAGSECVGMSGVTGSALRETSNINKSLSALADVLQALAESQTHVPYRNTKLTHILQDTIGGDSKLLIMLCVSPAQKYCTETLQCLGFGCRARQVARGPAKKRRGSAFNTQITAISSAETSRPPLSRSGSARR